jgi:hypothetical protein
MKEEQYNQVQHKLRLTDDQVFAWSYLMDHDSTLCDHTAKLVAKKFDVECFDDANEDQLEAFEEIGIEIGRRRMIDALMEGSSYKELVLE